MAFTPSLSMLCALAGAAYLPAYQIGSHLTDLGLECVAIVHSVARDIQAYVARDPLTGSVFIQFRGTASLKDGLDDIEFSLMDPPYLSVPCRVHRGFLGGYESVREMIWSAFDQVWHLSEHPEQKLYIGGHSLGGSIATLCALDYSDFRLCIPDIVLRTFGSPRVGDERYVALFASRSHINSVRVVHYEDVIPHVPLPLFYAHVSQLLHLSADGKLMREEPFLLGVAERIIEILDGKFLEEHAIASYQSSIELYEQSQVTA